MRPRRSGEDGSLGPGRPDADHAVGDEEEFPRCPVSLPVRYLVDDVGRRRPSRVNDRMPARRRARPGGVPACSDPCQAPSRKKVQTGMRIIGLRRKI